MSPHDTIIALSSPPGRSPRALLRLSGPQALAIVDALTATPAIRHPPSAIPPNRPQPSFLHIALKRLNTTSCLSLPALLTTFPAPHSYTAQHLAELQLPGNPALLDRVIHLFLNLGARLALPGEFTFRAFLAGKLDLTQAEGVAATIAADSDSQLHAATLLRNGDLGRLASQLVDSLADNLALVEAAIDFTDQDDVVPITPAQLTANLLPIAQQLTDLLTHSRPWRQLESLPTVVLVGPPSSGKSSLFNALLNRPRALTSAIPGTTRDVLREPLTIPLSPGERAGVRAAPPNEKNITDAHSSPQIEIMLLDIAGLDTPLTALDHQVQVAARHAITHADLILQIDDASHPQQHPPHLPATPTIHVRTKSDLPQSPRPPISASPRLPLVHTSAHTRQGLPQLRALIAQHLAAQGVSISAQTLALQPRHESALNSAHENLTAALTLLHPQQHNRAISNIELIATSLRTALDHLAHLGGQLSPDDLLSRVFATFCIGK